MGKKKKQKLNQRHIIGLVLTTLVSGAIWASFNWSDYIGLNRVDTLKIYGAEIIPSSEYSDILSPLIDENIHTIDTREMSLLLESHPFVHAARVSKEYPNNLVVEIMERKPVALINMDPILFIDGHGIVLPELGNVQDYIVPILSGFNSARELYPIGSQTVSQKVLESMELIELLMSEYPSLYNNLSEITVNKDDEFMLILAEYPTKVILGAENYWQKINILNAFAESLPKNKNLNHFTLLDLRYKKQIIAKVRA